MTSLCRHLSAPDIVNWVTTADGCVHTADADTTKQFRRVGGVYWALVLKHGCRQILQSKIVVNDPLFVGHERPVCVSLLGESVAVVV